MRTDRSWRLRLVREFSAVVGAVILFGSWVVQQGLVQRTTNEQRELSQAWSVYLIYQSHNALFNALLESIGEDSAAVDRITRFQVYNYEAGLRTMQELLGPTLRPKIIPPSLDTWEDGISSDQLWGRTQERLVALQVALFDRQAELDARNRVQQRLFSCMYLVGSCLVLLGACLKAKAGLDKECGIS